MSIPLLVPPMHEDIWLVGLYFGCPCGGDKNPCTCHMHEIRKSMSFKEFGEYVKLLSDEDKRKILCKHFTCVNNVVK